MQAPAPRLSIFRQQRGIAARILKVNHAGEHGAVQIYAAQAQVARLTAPDLVPELLDFKAHEQGHRAIFANELQRRAQARCRSYWLCGLGGYLLGLFSACLGRQAIAATTVAVERVVLRHLQQQLTLLRDVDAQALAAVEAIVAEEREHHDRAAHRLDRPGRGIRLLQAGVAAVTEAVIAVGMRL